ncbi:MAG: lysophospholipid acyltransferase family protein [Planctomycetota bacterium]
MEAAEAINKPAGTLKDWIAYIALRCVICGIQCLSLEGCDRLARVLAKVLADWIPIRRRVTDENLERVYGQISAEHKSLLRQKMWHNLILLVCEIALASRKIHRHNYRDHFYMFQKEAVIKLLLEVRPTVFVTGHFGNFEVAGFSVGLLGTPTTTIARPLDNPYIDAFVQEFRSRGGQKMLPKDGSAVKVQELLEAGGTLALLADQHAGGKGVWVDFFGEATSCHKALALFVLSSGAPMIVNYTRRLDRPLKYELGAKAIADPALLESENPPEYLSSVLELTEWYNAHLENIIREAPEQYWWLHRRWRGVPEKVLRRIERRRQQKSEQRRAA